MGKLKFTTLDAIRGLAALFVVVRHSGEFFGGNPFYNSFLAVDIFFLLSGFVIAHAYDKKIVENIISPREFIIIRLVRLYPAYILSVVLCLVVVIVKLSRSSIDNDAMLFVNLLMTSFFLPNFFPAISASAPLFPLNTVFWSLFYELAVNIFYVLTRKIQVEKIIGMLITLSAILIFLFAFKYKSIDAGFSWGIGSIAIGSARAFFGIFLGMYLYKIRNFSWFDRMNSLSTLGPLIIITAILAMPDIGTITWIFQLAAVLFIFPICVLWASKSTANKMMDGILVSLGLMSYPAYVLHVPVTQLLNSFLKPEILKFAPYSGLIFISLFFVFCLAVEKFYERPVRKYLHKVFLAPSFGQQSAAQTI